MMRTKRILSGGDIKRSRPISEAEVIRLETDEALINGEVNKEGGILIG